jgi:hypothetical protein
LECLTCTLAQQSALFCTSCCVTRAATTTHHHHMSNFISKSDTIVHDEVARQLGWEARKSGIGITWYWHRPSKVKTFERPKPAAPVLQPQVLPVYSNVPVQTYQAVPQNGPMPSNVPLVQATVPRNAIQQMQPTPQGRQVPQRPPNMPLRPQPQVQANPQLQSRQPMQSNSFVHSNIPLQPVQAQSTTNVQVRSPASPNRQLPTGWEEIRDPNGRLFYYHRASKVSTWNSPLINQLPPGWVECKDPDGRVYYSNSALGKMSWEHPVASSPAVNKSPRNSLSSASSGPQHTQSTNWEGQPLQPDNSRRSSTFSIKSLKPQSPTGFTAVIRTIIRIN